MTNVRDAFFDVLRHTGMTTIFANPGSTEVPLLADLPADLRFVLCLHEGSVVGAATGWAIGSQHPAIALLHTTAGLGNAVGAIATARTNRVPLVIVVGQQDRRHLASEPFLTGQLDGLAGGYPVWVATPARAADVPATIARAHHEAVVARGPAIVIVPMDDWASAYDETVRLAAPRQLRVAAAVDEELCSAVADRLATAQAPVLVAGAGADDPRTWDALVELADALHCPVWQEPFGARAGFPQDSPRFAGHLPAGRAGVRQALERHDLVLVIGAAALRQYAYEDGPLFADNVEVIVITDDDAEAVRSIADLAVLTPLPDFCALLAKQAAVQERQPGRQQPRALVDTGPAYQPGEALSAGHVFAALRTRLPADAVVVEESPSSRAQLQSVVPARRSLGFLSAAMGGLGFAMPAAMGLKMACPDRPVVAVVGDGSSMYSCQSLWSAQHYSVGVVFIVLSNGGYAIMNQLASAAGGRAPWPQFDDINVGTLAQSFGCPAVRITDHDELLSVLDRTLPSLGTRTSPLLLDVIVTP